MQPMCIATERSRPAAAILCITPAPAWYRAGTNVPWRGPRSRDVRSAAMQGVEFQGFAGDCTITGRITMFGERLTDFLNGQERFRSTRSSSRASTTATPWPRTRSASSATTSSPSSARGRAGTRSSGSSSKRPGCSCRSGRTSSWAGSTSRPARTRCATSCGASRWCRSPASRWPTASAARSSRATCGRSSSTATWSSGSRPPTRKPSLFPEATIRSPFSMNLRKDFTGPSTL